MFFNKKKNIHDDNKDKKTYSDNTKPLPAKTRPIQDIKFPIKNDTDLGDVFKTNDNKFKACFFVVPINKKTMSQTDLTKVAESIQIALCSVDVQRIGIYIQSERYNIQRNIVNVEERINHKKIQAEPLLERFLIEQNQQLKTMTSKLSAIKRFYIVVESKNKDIIPATSFMEEIEESMRKGLEGGGLSLIGLKEYGVKRMLYERINPDLSSLVPYHDKMGLYDIYPRNVIEFEDNQTIQVNKRLYRHYAISDYPDTVNDFNWMDELFEHQAFINFAIVMNRKPEKEALEMLSKTADKANALKLSAEKAHKVQEYQDEYDSSIHMIKEIGSNKNRYFDTSIICSVSGTSAENLDRECNVFESAVGRCFCSSTPLMNKGLDPWYTTMPLLHTTIITDNYTHPLTAKDIGSMIPFSSSEFIEDKGNIIGKNKQTDSPVVIDVFNDIIHNNPHIQIIGDSGVGKSHLIRTLVKRMLPYRDYIINFDLDGSFRLPFCDKIKFSSTSGVITNPFHIRNTQFSKDDSSASSNNVGDYLNFKILEMLDFYKYILKDKYDESIVLEDIEDCFDKIVGLNYDSTELPSIFPTMSDHYNLNQSKIDSMKNDDDQEEERKARLSIQRVLKHFHQGVYKRYFNGQTTWDFRKLTVFDLSATPDAIKIPLYDILLKDTTQFLKKDGTIDFMSELINKSIIIDEEHIFADDEYPQTLKFIAQDLVKMIRKYGVQVIGATQAAYDILSIKKWGQAIFDHSYFKIFFMLGRSDIQGDIATYYDFTEEERKILVGSEQGQASELVKLSNIGKFVLMMGGQRIICESVNTQAELEYISPKAFKRETGQTSRYISDEENFVKEFVFDVR